MNLAGHFLCGVVRFSTNTLCRIEHKTLRQIPQKGPLILIMNHIGSLEVPLFFAHLQPRPITGFAKSETWDSKFMGWLFTTWGAIPIRRGEADLQAVRRGLDFLRGGGILAIAPEGTRSCHGRLLRGHPGVILVAQKSGAPILPVAHWGGEDFSRNIKSFHRTGFHIKVGRPFRLKDSDGKRIAHEKRQAITDEIMYQLSALLPESYRGEYADLSQATNRYLVFDDQ